MAYKTRKKSSRPKSSYRAKSPEARAAQLANLRKGPGTPRITANSTLPDEVLANMEILTFCKDVLRLTLYPAQIVILAAQYGLPLNHRQMEIYRDLTGLDSYRPGTELSEAVWILGARSGKSHLASAVSLYESICRAHLWRRDLNLGEVGNFLLVAVRLQQSITIIGSNVARMLGHSTIPGIVAESFQQELLLKNDMRIMSLPCSSRVARGMACIGTALDECAWMQYEGIRSDSELFNSIRPRMSQFHGKGGMTGPKSLVITTPAGKSGLAWSMYSEGVVPDRLTLKAPTVLVNPTVDLGFLEKEEKRDPDNYRREYLAEFSENVESFFTAESVEKCCVLADDILPQPGVRYYGAIDASGLSGRDKFALAIASRTKGDNFQVDLCRAWATKSGAAIIADIKVILADYGITTILIDRFSKGWVSEQFTNIGIATELRPLLPEIYTNLRKLMLANAVQMPNTGPVKTGLLRTIGYYGRSGTLSIGHERSTESGHADECDGIASAVWACSSVRHKGYLSESLERMDARLRKAI